MGLKIYKSNLPVLAKLIRYVYTAAPEITDASECYGFLSPLLNLLGLIISNIILYRFMHAHQSLPTEAHQLTPLHIA